MLATKPAVPKLMVCDLEDLLHDRDAESDLLETWMAWDHEHRPLLLFHSRLSLEELQRSLPASVLPPADFLVGGGTSMLVRFSFWNQGPDGEIECSRSSVVSDARQLLASMATQALSNVTAHGAPVTPEFPQVETAILTTSGLSVTFGSAGSSKRPQSCSAILSWIVCQLNLEASEICTYVRQRQIRRPRLRLSTR